MSRGEQCMHITVFKQAGEPPVEAKVKVQLPTTKTFSLNIYLCTVLHLRVICVTCTKKDQ